MSDSTRMLLSYAVVYFFAFLFGVSIGSFLNVCIYRLPKNESLIKRNSHCMTCGEYIKHRDLIPIISWCLLRGKCRNCGAKISPRYTVVEALTGILFLLVSFHFDPIINTWQTILTCLLFAALVVVFFMDWDTQLISMYMVIFIGVLAVCQYFLVVRPYQTMTLKSIIIGFFIVSVPIFLIALISKERAMGMGDAYLMAAAGLFLGMQGSLVAFAIAIITGSIGGLIQKHINGESKFAFGPYLSIGIAIAALYAEPIAEFYMNFTGLNEMLA